MSILSTGWLFNTLRPTISHITNQALCPALYIQSRDYAARKGTRMRKQAIYKANKLKNEAARNKRLAAEKARQQLNPTHVKGGLVYIDDSKKADIPAENVYVTRSYKWKVYTFEDAIECHRETHAPDMFNQPNEHVDALIEFNLQTKKKSKYLEKIDRVVVVPHIFPQTSPKSIIFFSDDGNHQKTALDAGADVAAGTDILKQIQTGTYSLEEHDYFLAHPDILPQLLLLKGIFKNRLPSQIVGTLSSDVRGVVSKYRHGIHCILEKSTVKEDYGIIKAEIGTLDMDTKHLEENFKALLQDLMLIRPKRPGPFFLRTRLCCSPSNELLVVDYNRHITDPYITKNDTVEADDDEDDTRGVIGAV